MRLIIHILIVYTIFGIVSIIGYFLSRSKSKIFFAFKFVGIFWFFIGLLFCMGQVPFLFINSSPGSKSDFISYYGYIELSIGLPILICSLFYLSRKHFWPTIFFKLLCWLLIMIFSLTIISIVPFVDISFSAIAHLLSLRFIVLYYIIVVVYISCIYMIRALTNLEIFATQKADYKTTVVSPDGETGKIKKRTPKENYE